MIRYEINKTNLSLKGKLVATFLLLISLLDNFLTFVQTRPMHGYYGTHPAYMSLLSGQGSIACYAMYVWLLPIILLVLYSGNNISEKNDGIRTVSLIKVGKNAYFFSKLSVSFVISIIYTSIPLLLNFVIDCIFLHSNTSFLGIEDMGEKNIGSFLFWCIKHPFLSWALYFIIAELVFGLLGILCQSISLIIPDLKSTFLLCFSIWISFFCFSINIPKIIQPYTEYSLMNAIPSIISYLSVVIVSFVISYLLFLRKTDEI